MISKISCHFNNAAKITQAKVTKTFYTVEDFCVNLTNTFLNKRNFTLNG